MSGFRDDHEAYIDEEAHSAAAGTNAAASIEAGHPFSLLLAEDERQRLTALDALLDTLADGRTRFARATNPLRARLTLERLLIQVIVNYPDGTETAPGIIRRIAERRGDETRVLLVIERAETLHPDVLRFFGDTAALFFDQTPRLQVLFVGRPEFRALLDNPDAGLEEQTQGLEAYRPIEPEEPVEAAPAFTIETLPQRPVPFVDTSLRAQFLSVWRTGIWTRLGMVGGTLVGIGAITFAVTIALSGNRPPVRVDTGSTLLEMPDPPETEPDPPALQPGPPADPATAQLRSEFESYLTASGRDLASMTPAQKRNVYQEFLVWRARTGARR
jgi:hypothetical protein